LGPISAIETWTIAFVVSPLRVGYGVLDVLVTAGKSHWSEQPEFVVVTHWRSVDALQEFTGPDWQEAVIEPEEHMLAEVFCDHYETIETG
jgi:heme-degrading monooxygenase HmoA